MKMKTIKVFIIFAILFIVNPNTFAQDIISKSFELRYFSKDAKANGETDFKGPTSVFDTDQRVEFLKHYAAFASEFFNDPNFDYDVASDDEAAKAAQAIKPQPEPEFRNRIQLEDWKWLGYRAGQEKEKRAWPLWPRPLVLARNRLVVALAGGCALFGRFRLGRFRLGRFRLG